MNHTLTRRIFVNWSPDPPASWPATKTTLSLCIFEEFFRGMKVLTSFPFGAPWSLSSSRTEEAGQQVARSDNLTYAEITRAIGWPQQFIRLITHSSYAEWRNAPRLAAWPKNLGTWGHRDRSWGRRCWKDERLRGNAPGVIYLVLMEWRYSMAIAQSRHSRSLFFSLRRTLPRRKNFSRLPCSQSSKTNAMDGGMTDIP